MLIQKENMDMLIAHKVYTESELLARHDILLENYCKTVRIEALTMVEMVPKEILPAVESYVPPLTTFSAKRAFPHYTSHATTNKNLITRLATLVDTIDASNRTGIATVKLDMTSDLTEKGAFIRDDYSAKNECIARCFRRSGDLNRSELLAVSYLRRVAVWCKIALS